MAKPVSNPLDIPLFGGLINVELPVAQFDLGEGIHLRRTYCAVMIPELGAFGDSMEDKYKYWAVVNGLGVMSPFLYSFSVLFNQRAERSRTIKQTFQWTERFDTPQ